MSDNELSAYNVLIDSFEPMQTAPIAKAISEVTHTPVFDATQRLVKCRGFLMENCPEESAQKLVEQLKAANINSRIFQNKEIVQLAEFVEIKKAVLQPDGFSYSAEDSENLMKVEWKNFTLLSAGVFNEEIRSQHTEMRGPSTGERVARIGLMAAGLPVGFGKKKKVIVKTKETNLYFCLDLFTSNPVSRIRIEPESFNFDCLKDKMTYSSTTNFRLFILELCRYAAVAHKNQGTEFIVSGKPLNLLHYDSPSDFDKESRWILSIKGYG